MATTPLFHLGSKTTVDLRSRKQLSFITDSMAAFVICLSTLLRSLL